MAGDAVVAGGCPIALRRGGLEMVLILVVEDERGLAIILMDAMRERAERGHAQRHHQHLRGRAQQPRWDTQHDAHAHSVSSACKGVKTVRAAPDAGRASRATAELRSRLHPRMPATSGYPEGGVQ